MRSLLTLSMLGLMAGLAEPQLAQSVGFDPLDSTTQFGVCGLLGGIVLALVLRTIPQQAKTHADAIKDAAQTTKAGLDSVASEMSGLRSDIADDMQARNKFLMDALKPKP